MGEPRESHNVALGQAVQRLRQEAGLTEEELANQAQLPIDELRQIERGDIDADWGTIRHIAYALKVSLADLLQQVEEPPTP